MAMPDVEWQLLDRALDELLDLDPTARELRLAEMQAGNPARVRSLRRLLSGLARSEALEHEAGPALIARALGQWSEMAAGTRLGEWTVLRRIGAGGMAEVYEAERSLGQARQRAAIKLMSASVVGTVGRQGFLREMSILAQLDDPRLSRLIDAGEWVDGRPWLAMEYVEGSHLLQACDQRRLDLRARVRLLIDIAQAVDHAHRQLVIHRDLKPANILLDGSGRPRVLDFGIAKLLDPGELDGERTRSVWQAYTLQHASPEQLAGRNTGVSSDVYQLGLLLFLLLTGTRAFSGQDDDAMRLLQAMRDGAPLASQHAAAAGEEVAKARASRPGRLARQLRGDLDSILLAALQFDPAQRYLSAEALAADLQRWLDGQPVRVRAASRTYRLRRWLRRHWAAAGISALLLLGLGGYGLLTALQRDQLQAERQRTEAVLDALTQLLSNADPYAVESGSLSVAELVQRTADDLLAGQRGDPAVQALLMERLAAISGSARDFPREAALLQGAHQLAVEHALRPALASRLQLALAKSQASGGDFEQARDSLQQAWPGLSAQDQHSARLLQAQLLRESGDEGAAVLALQALLQALPDDPQLAAVRGNAHNSLALALSSLGRLDEAVEQYRQALITAPRELPGDQDLLAIIRSNMAVALARQGRYGEAEAAFSELLQWRIETLGAEHPAVATAVSVYVPLLLRTHRFRSAWRLLVRHRAAADHPGAALRRADYLFNMGRAGLYAGHPVEALGSLLEAAQLTAPLADQAPSNRHLVVLEQLAFALLEVGADAPALALSDALQRSGRALAPTTRMVRLLASRNEDDPAQRQAHRQALLEDPCHGPEWRLIEAVQSGRDYLGPALPARCEGPVSARWQALGQSWLPGWSVAVEPEAFDSPLVQRLRRGSGIALPDEMRSRLATLLHAHEAAVDQAAKAR